MVTDFATYTITSVGRVTRTKLQRVRLESEAANLAATYQPVTLRQLFYLLVNSGWLSKTELEYKNLGSLLTKARRAGRVPWKHIVDSGRYNRRVAQWSGPADAVRSLINQYRLDAWMDQPQRVYIGVEKEALAGVMQPVCDEFGVTLVVARGYPSATYLHDLEVLFGNAQLDISRKFHGALTASRREGQVHFFYYGDHDPSGDGISTLFEQGNVDGSTYGLPCHFVRSALTAEQIIEKDYLTRPPKSGDSRTALWNDGGAEAADVDTIDPDELRDMIRSDILSVMDADIWSATQTAEAEHIDRMESFAEEMQTMLEPS